jgi:hypothetical protein
MKTQLTPTLRRTIVTLQARRSTLSLLGKTLLLLTLSYLALQSLTAQTCTPGTGSKVTLKPGDDVQNIVNTTPCGSTFTFTPGVYPNLTIYPIDESTNPIDGDAFVGQYARTSLKQSILYGGTVVSNFEPQGKYWVGSVTTTVAPSSPGEILCQTTNPGCLLPEDLFFDGKLYRRVTSEAAVVTGTWYLNYSTSTAYLVDNPTGHKIEISVTHFAIYAGNVANVRIANLVIDKYAAPGGFGAISGVDPTGATTQPTYKWAVSSVEVRNCHGAGIWLGNHMNVVNSFLHNNGEFGVAGTGNSINFGSNEVSFNNLAGFVPAWGGGTKFSQVLGLTAEHNNIHDNLGPGLWDDSGTTNLTYAFNTTKNNQVAGIFHEIGGTASIYSNTVTSDGIDKRGSGLWYGAGIMISNSDNTKVYNNTIVNSQNGIMEQAKDRPDCTAPCYLKDVSVYSNNITQDHTVMPNTVATGILVSSTYPLGDAAYTTSGNTFGINPTTKAAAPNTYTLTPTTGELFVWLQGGVADTTITLSQWQADGNN